MDLISTVSTELAILVGDLKISAQALFHRPGCRSSHDGEVREASKLSPRIVMAAPTFDGALGFLMLVPISFCVGVLRIFFTRSPYKSLSNSGRYGTFIQLTDGCGRSQVPDLFLSAGLSDKFNQLTNVRKIAHQASRKFAYATRD